MFLCIILLILLGQVRSDNLTSQIRGEAYEVKLSSKSSHKIPNLYGMMYEDINVRETISILRPDHHIRLWILSSTLFL